MGSDELIVNKLFNISNKINNNKEGYLTTVGNSRLSNELLETLKIVENCTSCKDGIKRKKYFNKFRKSINGMENWLTELEKEQRNENKKLINQLNNELIYVNEELSGSILCKGCKEKKLKMDLRNKCFNILNEII